MFQTEPIKFLQASGTDGLTDVLWFVSQFGDSTFYIPVLILITFGVSFRRGFLLIQMMLCVGLLTDMLKNLFALPRPSDVDAAVLLLEEGAPNATPFTGMGGRGFWDLPDAEAIRAIRAEPDWSYGLPSGHVSGTTTFWGGLSFVFRSPAIRVAALAMILLMPLSRMYLGRHFLADVLGGFVLASAILVAARVLFVSPECHGRLLSLRRLRLRVDVRSAAVVAFLLVTPLLLATMDRLVETEYAGRLLGLNVGFLALALTGLPDDAGTRYERVGRVVLACALFAGTTWAVNLVVGAGPFDTASRWTELVTAAVPVSACFWGGVTAGRRLGLFARA